jgi:hypothetical protein
LFVASFIATILRERDAYHHVIVAPMNHAFSAWAGWAMAAAAVLVGYVGYGWRGVALAVTVTAFWLLLQFSRALRVLRTASANPVGQVPNAVMFHAKLHKGMRLPAMLKITRSLGNKVGQAEASANDESFSWTDRGGDSVQVRLQAGRLTEWQLQRRPDPAEPEAPPEREPKAAQDPPAA